MPDQSPMDPSAFVTDAFLQSVLQAAADARQQCLQMLDFIDQNRAAHPDADAEMRLSRQQKLLHANLAKLRGLNRRALLETRNTKQQTQEAKSEIDSLHLHLQNLYYEQRHLIGDIAACQGYKSVVVLLPLVAQSSNIFTVTNTNLYL
jgi:THO complex subunit 5